MDSEIMVQPLPQLGVCNLCLKYGGVKSMLLAYKTKLGKETYSEMLFRCFSIDISILKLGDIKQLICEECAQKLCDATEFRTLAEQSLLNLQESARLGGVKNEEEAAAPDLEAVNEELAEEFDDYNDADDPDYSMDIKIKEDPDPEAPKAKRKKSEKVRKTRKKNDMNETEALLKSGLFPFKIRKSTYSCAVCSHKNSNLEELKNHVLSHEMSLLHLALKKSIVNLQRFYKCKDKLRCKLCLADINNFDELKSHVNGCERLNYSTKSNLPFKLEKDQTNCPICAKTFLNFVSLNSHMNVHFPNYICENCGKAFASKSRLRGHVRTHEIGEFPCKYCDQIFDKVTKRENHVSKEHKAGVRYFCRRCNLSLTSFYAKQKHLAEVHNEELKRYKCKACSHSYITPGHLSSHVRRDHLNERNHKCNQCDNAFYSSNALKMHMIKHDGERIHVCPVCNKSYQRKKTLREHLRIHDNDKRFVCPVCGRAFTQKCTLKGHLRVHERKLEGSEVTVGL